MARPVDLSSAASLEEQVYLSILALNALISAHGEDATPDNVSLEFDLSEKTLSVSLKMPIFIGFFPNEKRLKLGAIRYLADISPPDVPEPSEPLSN